MKAISLTATVVLAALAVWFSHTDYSRNPDTDAATWATTNGAGAFRPGLTKEDIPALVAAGVPASDLAGELWAGEPTAVDSFMIMRHEVTRAEYATFLASEAGAGVAAPAAWQGSRRPPEDTGSLPVAGVSLADAQAYAAWRHARLPTEIEWELATRTEALRFFPWGNVVDAGRTVASRPGPEPARDERYRYGELYHASGNVAEWTSSSYAGWGGGAANTSPDSVVVRGGSFKTGPAGCRLTARRRVDPRRGYDDVGFRLVRDI